MRFQLPTPIAHGITILCVLPLLGFLPIKDLNAQQSAVTATIGATASNISGYGIYYQVALNEKIAVRAILLGYLLMRSIEDTRFTNYNADIGFELQTTLRQLKYTRFYTLVGTYYYYDYEEEETGINADKTDDKRRLHSVSGGAGLGIEQRFGSVLIHVHGGYKLFYDQADISGSKRVNGKETIVHLKPGGGLGLGFAF